MAVKPKKTNRKIIFILAALCIAVIIGWDISIAFYYSGIANKNTQIQNLNDEITAIEAQFANQTAALRVPRLISLGLQYFDNRTNPNAPYLQVTGYVVNVGGSTAGNCSIRVVAIQNGNSTGLDVMSGLNPLSAGNWEQVNLQLPYSGQALIAFTDTLYWNS